MSDQQAKWDNRFLNLAYTVEQWSKDPSMKVGAVIVDSSNRVLGIGYNGFPRGVKDTEERYADRLGFKYPAVVHAEVNAILNSYVDLRGATLYCSTGVPCPDCAGPIIQAGITRVVFPLQRGPKVTGTKVDWEEKGKLSLLLFSEAEPTPVVTHCVSDWSRDF
jgi:dCMP deaminase